MKSLTCVVVGDGSVFGVDIDELKKVWHLKDMIKERKMYNFPADQLTLYIAKRSGDWLSSADPDVQRLEDGETPHGITALMNDASKMNPKCRIRNVAFGFPDEADAGEDEIHILVDVPKYIKTGPHCDPEQENPESWHPGMASPVSNSWNWLSAIFSSAETASSSVQKGRLKQWRVHVNVLGILLHVSPSMLAVLLAWKWYWETRSKEERSRLQFGYGS